MSSLWTPGGEVPIDREPKAEPAPDPPDSRATPAPGSAPGTPSEADLERLRQEVVDTPAADIVVQHAMGLYELAALHLSQPEPKLAEARVAIDALAALLEGMAGRLGPSEEPLASALPQLKMAYVQATDRARTGATPDPSTPDSSPPPS